MEMMQVGFLVVGIFILWSSMNLTAPAPVTPNDVTGELNSMLEFIQKLRKRETAKAGSDRRKQEQMDKIFEEVEEQIEDLLHHTTVDQTGATSTLGLRKGSTGNWVSPPQ